MPRFVILEHDHPTLHWDLMLEAGAALHTWRLAQPPRPGARIQATALPDHRIMYLDYEGPVSGNRGQVRCWERGTFVEAADSQADDRRLVLAGTLLIGLARLQKLPDDAWQFECQSS